MVKVTLSWLRWRRGGGAAGAGLVRTRMDAGVVFALCRIFVPCRLAYASR